jgi:RNA polymerase sigma-70 factor (ECF subfamily)
MKPDSGFVFSKAYEADGSVNIAVSGKWQEDQQQQIVAIDNNGGSYATRIEPGGNARFDNWKLSQIKEFRVRTRPYQWVEFKTVSLRPGGKTDVQVEVEKKKRAFWEENAVSYSWAPVKEGVGLDCFIIGDAKCTGEFIKSKLGEPEKEKKDEKEGWWLVYHKKYGLDFWLNLQENTLYEIRLNKGFTGKLTSGISMFSTKQDVFKTYGEPIRETAADNLTNLFDDRVLFVGKDGISKINYKEKGVLFWFDGDKINQIRVGAVSSASNIDVAVEDFNIIPYPEGGLYTVTVSIRNKGGAESPKFGVNFYRGNPKPMTHEAGPIKPGDVWYEGSMPFALNEGTNEFVVVLDPDGAIGETDRTNNEASMKVTVKDGKIVEKKVSLSSAKSISKETKGVSAQIINAAEFGDTNGANAGKDNRMSRPEQTGAPVVVKTSPKTLANDVSADLNQITVTFNQQMTDKSWSWVRMDIRYPETTGSPYYDNEKKTCALPVKLEAGKAYLVAFNIEPYLGFVNSKGAPAKPYVLVFATKDKDGKPTPIPEELIVKAKSINDLLQEMSPEAKGEENKAGSVPYTQIIYDDIQPDGTIAFKNPIREMNKSGRTITTNNFINSDFVQVTGMRDADGNDLKLTSIHDGSIYRYEVTFNKPIPPGELIEYTSEGTMKGLIKPVAGSEGVFQYYMRHSPAAGEPTQRIETYLLPAGAELISTTPEDMERRTKDGRIELHVEKMIPIGGSITTSFRYRMP